VIYYFLARIQPDKTVEMEPTRPHFHTGPLMHRVTKQFGDLAIVVWWPERLDPTVEDYLVELYLKKTARELGLKSAF
jgi:hypothetical protein